jgi:chaperonin cofactor prefoldin
VIDVRLLRTNPDGVRAALARRCKPDVMAQLERALEIEGQVRELQSRRDAVRAEVNELSKQVGLKRREGDAAGAEALQAQSRALGEQEKAAADELEGIQAELRDLLRVYRATPWQTLITLEIPAALPVLIGGLKIGATLAVIGAVVGEYVGSDRGLGYLINFARGTYDTPLVIAGVLTLVALALALYGVGWSRRIER